MRIACPTGCNNSVARVGPTENPATDILISYRAAIGHDSELLRAQRNRISTHLRKHDRKTVLFTGLLAPGEIFDIEGLILSVCELNTDRAVVVLVDHSVGGDNRDSALQVALYACLGN